jgi:hypothetical protein
MAFGGFTDECSIAAGAKRGTAWVTQEAGEEYEEACLVPKFSHIGSHDMESAACRKEGTVCYLE